MEKDEAGWESSLKMPVTEVVNVESDEEEGAVTQLAFAQQRDASEELAEDEEDEEGEEDDNLSIWEDILSAEESDDIDQSCTRGLATSSRAQLTII